MIRRTTWITLAVFVVLIGAALLLQKYPVLQGKATPTATEYPLLLQGWLPDDMTMIEIKNDKGETVALQHNPDKTWAFVNVPGKLPDQGKVTEFIDSLTSMNVLASFDATTSLENVGLTAPSYLITLQNSKGNKKVIRVGKATAIGSGYYIQVDNNLPVLVSTDSLNQVTSLASLDALTLVTPTPTVVEATTTTPSTTETLEPTTTGTPIPTSTPGPSPTPVILTTPVILITPTP
jgi:hypothetical protein